MYERFTSGARNAMRTAAQRANPGPISAEHLLLSLIEDQTGLAQQVLQLHGANLSQIRQKVEACVLNVPLTDRPPSEGATRSGMSDAVGRIVVGALDESHYLGHEHVDTEHLLLGVIREATTDAARILASADISIESARQLIRTIRNQPRPVG